MRRFVVIATTVRGVVAPGEELDEEEQRMANRQADMDEAQDRNMPLEREKGALLRRMDRVQRLMHLAGRKR